jgi:hypothetical protein
MNDFVEVRQRLGSLPPTLVHAEQLPDREWCRWVTHRIRNGECKFRFAKWQEWIIMSGV